ncbi:MAG: SpoIIE family protein phosphatase [Oscillospiraceae bacterium]|jgi:serine/threonine protein phosphatase PrpC|nr:SpoIIE family protein phosphatase [Oscillospiraceae bacterium]
MPYIILSGCAFAALLIARAALGMTWLPAGPEVARAQTIGKRQINADVFEWSARGSAVLLVLADGIGTGAKGRAAALAAADSAVRTFELQGASNPAYFFRLAFHNANEAVLRYVPDGTAGANLLCVLVTEGLLYYALAGNCRVSVFRKSELIPLSEGQTLDALAGSAFRKRAISREEALSVHGTRRVYNYAGRDGFKEPETSDIPVRLKTGDCVVLTTDGVYEFCPAPDLERILKTGRSCRRKADAVIDLLERRGDPQQDNATVVLARFGR